MDPIDYYHQQFPADLDFISRAGPYSTVGKISFFTLLPSTVLGLKQVKGCELQEFRSVENKHLFLMCYFFLTILDQAIHFNLRSEHKFFDFIARYPKFKGFLVTSHNNMHPNSLLVFATVYIKYFSVFGATEDFRSLSRIMLRNICDFLRNTYPAMTERLPTKNQREEAVSIILNTIESGIFEYEVDRRWLETLGFPSDMNMFNEWIQTLKNQLDFEINSPFNTMKANSKSSLLLLNPKRIWASELPVFL